MPQLDAVLETALYVDDLDRAVRFYSDVLELKPLYQDSRLRAFSVGGRNVLLLFPRGGSLETVHMPGGTIPPHDGSGRCMSPSPSPRTSCRSGRSASAPTTSRSKAAPPGSAAARASTSAIPTAICSSSRRRACGRSIDDPIAAPSLRPPDAGARPGHLGHGREARRVRRRGRGAEARARSRHDADRHRGNVWRRRRREGRRRSDRGPARRSVPGQQGLSAQCLAERRRRGLRAQPQAAQDRPSRRLSAALARRRAARRRRSKRSPR